MSVHRVRIARDKAELVQSLVNAKDTTAPFQTYADAIAFAASLGALEGKKRLLLEVAKEPAPISLEIFISRGYERMMKLLAVTATEDFSLLIDGDDQAVVRRVEIFEEYANAGLEKLRDELRGAVDYTDRLLLSIAKLTSLGAIESTPIAEEEFDLSRFLEQL
jgi:dnd system-associated protein 4